MNMQVINRNKPTGGFRELTSDEIMMVSGGDGEECDEIVVNGTRTVSTNIRATDLISSGTSGLPTQLSDPFAPSFDWSRFVSYTNDYSFSAAGSGGGGGGPTHHADGTDNDGDGIRETPPIVVTASATHGQIQAAHLSAQLSLYVSGVIASPVITIVGAQATAGLTLGQQVALNLAGAAVGAPLTNLLTQELYDSTFNQQLDQIQNPGSYPRTFLPY